MSLLDDIDFCAAMLEGQMSRGELTEFLQQNYEDIVPSPWQKTLREKDFLLSDESNLYRQFVRAGIYDSEKMTAIMLQLFYLIHRSQ